MRGGRTLPNNLNVHATLITAFSFCSVFNYDIDIARGWAAHNKGKSNSPIRLLAGLAFRESCLREEGGVRSPFY